MEAERDAISIDKSDVPYQFSIELSGELFDILVNYNTLFDYFTMDLYKDGEPVIYGAPIVYGTPMFSGVADVRLPKVQLLPFDVAGKELRAGFEEMNQTVFLFLMDGESNA